MDSEYVETVKDMFNFWYHCPDEFMRAYDHQVIEHTPAVEEVHSAIVAFGSDEQRGGSIWSDKNAYR